MSLHLNRSLNGPFVVCDQCNTRTNLSPNCAWGMKFVKISLKKLGMSVNGPHVCADCRHILSEALRKIPQDNDEVVRDIPS